MDAERIRCRDRTGDLSRFRVLLTGHCLLVDADLLSGLNGGRDGGRLGARAGDKGRRGPGSCSGDRGIKQSTGVGAGDGMRALPEVIGDIEDAIGAVIVIVGIDTG